LGYLFLSLSGTGLNDLTRLYEEMGK